MPRSIGRLGAAACTMRSQPAQASFGRTCRITLKRTCTYSRISDTSSPSGCNAYRHSPDKPFAAAYTYVFHAADDSAKTAAPVRPRAGQEELVAPQCGPRFFRLARLQLFEA